MTLPRRSLLVAGGAMLAAPALAQSVAGGRPVKLVVPFPPGGAVDILGRLIAERLGPALGQQVVVDNRGGAGGNIGAEAVARGPNDGSTIGIIAVTTLCAASALYRHMSFDPQKDLTPVSQVITGAVLCVVNAQTAEKNGWRDFRSLIAWARAHPGEVKMGSSGTGTTSHLTIEAVNKATNAQIVHVPYRGGGPAISDLIAGTIDMMFDVMPALMPHVQAGRFKAFAVSSANSLPFLPDIPGLGAFADLGLGNLDIQTWSAIMASHNTPDAVVAPLFRAVKQVAAQPEFADRLRPIGYQVQTSESPAALAELIRRETPRWHQLVRSSGVTLD